MDKARRLPPIWLLGFAPLPLGVFGGVSLITMPQLLAADHVPEPSIAAVTAFAMIPTVCAFLAAPILDWRFSRRFYATVLALVLAVVQFAALMARNAAGVLPITYMQAVDGAAYGAGGLKGTFLADAGLGLAACALLSLLLWFIARRRLGMVAA